VLRRERHEIAHRRRLHRRQTQRRAVLALPARTAQVHDQGARHGQRDVGAEVLLDQGQRQVDGGGHPGRGEHVAVADVDRVGLDLEARVARGQVGRGAPVGGHAAPVEQTGAREPRTA